MSNWVSYVTNIKDTIIFAERIERARYKIGNIGGCKCVCIYTACWNALCKQVYCKQICNTGTTAVPSY